ncbi:MAG: hypothetical protein JKX79_00545 [Labilibaculum sp.]|nr:hypothetical protein [Labilibaculum sp.]
MFKFGIAKLGIASQENSNVLEKHLFRLKVNEEFVINSYKEVEDLLQYLNDDDDEKVS